MKDLKHLIFFEDMLQEANNALVQQAISEGKRAIGYTCFQTPEVLLNLDKCFSVRMRAPRTGSMDIATYYLSNFLCGYCKAVLERGIEGGYNFLDAIITSETCSEMNRSMEHFEMLKLIPNDKFFVSFMDMPFKTTENCLNLYVSQVRAKLLQPLHDVYGVDISNEAIRKAVELHNKVCRLITEIGEFRKEGNPRITGYEFHVLSIASYSLPKYLIVDTLEETLEELKTREPDKKKRYRAKIVLVGSEMDDPDFTKIIEDSGALVVADRYCFGSFPGREQIVLRDDEDPIVTICRHYLEVSQCPRYMEHKKIQNRRDYVANLVKEFHADGVIYEQIKFCEYWGYERAIASHIMVKDYDIPAIAIDRQYTASASGQLRTRVQAFVESLEIKKIQRQKEDK